MNRLKIVACLIMPAVWKIPEQEATEILRHVLSQGDQIAGADMYVVVSLETLGRESWSGFHGFIKSHPNVSIREHNSNTTATAELYMEAYVQALQTGADLVLEMDLSGAHDPTEIQNLVHYAVELLRKDRGALVCVFSDRFMNGGANDFPSSRVRLSKYGTIFAKVLLGMDKGARQLNDFTSGYEAFSASLLRRMFQLVPPESWVSNKWGPMHLFQTEARALVYWLKRQGLEIVVIHKPIVFGRNFHRKLAPLTVSYLAKALVGGFLLAFEGIWIRTRGKKEYVMKTGS